MVFLSLTPRHGNLKEEEKRGFMRAISLQDFNPNIHIFVAALTVEMRQRLVKVSVKVKEENGENACREPFVFPMAMFAFRFVLRACPRAVLFSGWDLLLSGNLVLISRILTAFGTHISRGFHGSNRLSRVGSGRTRLTRPDPTRLDPTRENLKKPLTRPEPIHEISNNLLT